jgi:hypothetical protein
VPALLFRLSLATALVLAGAEAGRAQIVPAPQAYAQAVAVMATLPQSPYTSFTTSVATVGFGVRTQTEHDVASLVVGFGSAFKTTASWQVALRSADGKAVVRSADAPAAETHSQLFKPTWQGAYQWTRFGFGHPAVPPPQPVAPQTAAAQVGTPQSAASSAAAPDAADAGVIGRVQSISPGAYRIEDGPTETCPDGQAGRHLHLTAQISPETHPLTDVVIDDRAGRICTMRFNLVRGNAFSLTGVFDLDFGDRSGYWVVVDGAANVEFRVFGLGAKHASMRFAYTDFVFATQPPDPILAT